MIEQRVLIGMVVYDIAYGNVGPLLYRAVVLHHLRRGEPWRWIDLPPAVAGQLDKVEKLLMRLEAHLRRKGLSSGEREAVSL